MSRRAAARAWGSSAGARAWRRWRSSTFVTPADIGVARAMREIYLHDTRSGGLLRLQPLAPDRRPVGIYACGPTVYSRIHIGNARPFVIFSLLKRFLEHEGLKVRLVVNITDVNDKIYDAARAHDRAS